MKRLNGKKNVVKNTFREKALVGKQRIGEDQVKRPRGKTKLDWIEKP